MKQANLKSGAGSRSGRRAAALAAASVGLALSVSPAWSQSAIEAEADSPLRAMTDQLKALKSFSVEYDTDHEIVDLQGQKLQYSASGTMTVSRGAGLLVTRKGPYADVEVTFDGTVISLYGKGMNVYAQLDSPGGSIEEAIEEFRISTGLDAPGAELLDPDPYAALTENVVSGAYVGEAFVGGVECDHLAFRNNAVDWQIWISKGDQKLPMKYVITTKWLTGAPQYSLRLSHWNTGEVDAKLFSFTPPAGAKKLEEVKADAVGEIILEDAQ